MSRRARSRPRMNRLIVTLAVFLATTLIGPARAVDAPESALALLQAGVKALAWSPYRLQFELVTHDPSGEIRRLTGTAVSRPFPDAPSSYHVEARLTGPEGLDVTFEVASESGRVNVLDNAVATLWFGPSEPDGESLAELYLGELLPLVLDASKLAVVTGFHAEFGGKVRGNDVLCQEVVQPTSDGGSWSYSFDPWQHFPCQFTRSLPAGTPPKQSVLTILEMQQVFALKPGELTIHGADSAESRPFRTTPGSQ